MSAYDRHTQDCPYCGTVCEADWVDVGIGLVQCGPFHCEACNASEIGPYDKPRELTEDEQRTGWYYPFSEPGSSANVISGKIVSANVMKATYQKEFNNNPLWQNEKYVDDWWEDIRKE